MVFFWKVCKQFKCKLYSLPKFWKQLSSIITYFNNFYKVLQIKNISFKNIFKKLSTSYASQIVVQIHAQLPCISQITM